MKKLINILKCIGIGIAVVLQFIVWHMPVSVAALAGLYFSFRLFGQPTENTISITNYAFIIVATLSNLSFTFSRSIENDEDTKKKAEYCGERFLHSAILFVVASVVKYFLIQKDVSDFAATATHWTLLKFMLQAIPGALYLGSVVNAIAALRELNDILFRRKKPGQELLKLF